MKRRDPLQQQLLILIIFVVFLEEGVEKLIGSLQALVVFLAFEVLVSLAQLVDLVESVLGAPSLSALGPARSSGSSNGIHQENLLAEIVQEP